MTGPDDQRGLLRQLVLMLAAGIAVAVVAMLLLTLVLQGS